MSFNNRSWLQWTLAALTVTVAAMEFAVTLRNQQTPGHRVGVFDWLGSTVLTLPSISFTAVGALIVTRRRRNRIGWLMIAVGLGFAVGEFSTDYPSRPDRPFADFIAWIATWEWSFYWSSLLLLFLLFPTGELPGRRWRYVMWFGLAALALDRLIYVVRLGRIDSVPVNNITGIISVPLLISDAVDAAAFVALAAAVVSLILRFRTARGEVRQQLKWFTFGAALAIAFNVAAYAMTYNSVAGVGVMIAMTTLPAFMGIAILRYHLFAIDIILSRTLIYGSLTVFVIASYVLIVGYVGTLLPAGRGATLSLIATGLVAILFQPLREWLQRHVARLVYGDRDEPYAVLARLGQRVHGALTSEDLQPAIVETIGRALKLPFVMLLIDDAGTMVPAAHYPSDGPTAREGTLEGSRSITLPVVIQNERIGELHIALRPGEQQLSRADSLLLDDLSRQAGIAVQAARLTGELRTLTRDLQQSRERIVTAREEERRRLQRDLHDGLGPTLASGSFKVEAARNLLRRDPDQADALLAGVADQMQDAIVDLRRLVYHLRPPALDQLGLVDGLRQYTTQLDGETRFVVESPDELAPLPAAVEVAAYRIALEAMANVIRHADARVCRIRLAVDDTSLLLEVIDDGRGVPERPAHGVGLHSMHERAAELGGICAIGPRPEGGTMVRARMPLVAPAPAAVG